MHGEQLSEARTDDVIAVVLPAQHEPARQAVVAIDEAGVRARERRR
jgi:hypothetical protein